ncbi:MAG: hypothetical protein HY699_04000 [Deltaproteobacteria bacterium]|nr:hypothetical protein [Deltaproteobacteria bacterium]
MRSWLGLPAQRALSVLPARKVQPDRRAPRAPSWSVVPASLALPVLPAHKV